MTLVPVDTTNALAVSDYLDKAKQWLATAVEMTGPHEIASAKAEIATAAEATKQLGLSREIQLDAQEMVRRAEFALGRAIRKGQAEGTITKVGSRPNGIAPHERHRYGRDESTQGSVPNTTASLSPSDFIPHGSVLHETYALADVETEEFEAALAEAKAEGRPSRSNVIRKIQGGPTPTTRDQRADLIEELAAQGYSSRQMPIKVGVTEETVRQIARDFDIDIPADRSVNRTRRMDSTRIVTQTATALEGLAMGVELIDFASLNLEEVGQWTDSLSDSLRALNRFHKQLKETIQ